MISYDVEGTRAIIEDVRFIPIEFLGWDCLTIGALGWGQIQIANSNRITINPHYSRKRWMIELCPGHNAGILSRSEIANY